MDTRLKRLGLNRHCLLFLIESFIDAESTGCMQISNVLQADNYRVNLLRLDEVKADSALYDQISLELFAWVGRSCTICMLNNSFLDAESETRDV